MPIILYRTVYNWLAKNIFQKARLLLVNYFVHVIVKFVHYSEVLSISWRQKYVECMWLSAGGGDCPLQGGCPLFGVVSIIRCSTVYETWFDHQFYYSVVSIPIPNVLSCCRHIPPESRALIITTLSKDRVQEQVSDTNSGADEYVTKEESQYFTQVQSTKLQVRDLSLPWLLVGGQ